MMEALLEQLLKSPRLKLYRDEIDDVLRREQQRRQQFHDAMTEDTRAEFINGEVIVQSPAKLKHLLIVKRGSSLFDAYVSRNHLGLVTSEKALIGLTRNDYEPGICFWLAAKASQFRPNQMTFPAPDLVVEVLSDSTATIDRGVKFDDYAAHGVGEYWIIDPDTEAVEQYVLVTGRYELRSKATSGTISSLVIPGFTIGVRALFDDQEHLAALQAIVK
jgi:Uma2 family endonuclease